MNTPFPLFPFTSRFSHVTAALLLLSAISYQPSAFSQGSLTPPGVPAPTMKKLDEVEPRINIQRAINPLPTDANYHHIIAQPGSYYLTANLDVTKPNGIDVRAAGVTIDLNGFEIRRTSGAGGNGIEIDPASHRCTIKDGSITGFAYGVQVQFMIGGGGYARGGSFLQLSVSGCSSYGLFGGESWQMEGCKSQDNPGHGIFSGTASSLSNCTSSRNSGYGILTDTGSALINCTAVANLGAYGIGTTSGTLTNCNAYSNQGTYGIYAGPGSTLNNCAANNNNVEYGIYALGGSTLIGCAARGNTGNAGSSFGIYADSNCALSNCVATSTFTTNGSPTGSTGGGIYASDNSTVEHCTASNNSGDGIQVNADCYVMANMCDNNGVNGDAAGIHATAAGNRIESNNVTDNDRGIQVDSTGSFIVKNSATGSVGGAVNNYVIAAGNADAAVESPGTAFTSTNPWANFSY